MLQVHQESVKLGHKQWQIVQIAAPATGQGAVLAPLTDVPVDHRAPGHHEILATSGIISKEHNLEFGNNIFFPLLSIYCHF